MLVNDFTHPDQLATLRCLAWRDSSTTSSIQEKKKIKKGLTPFLVLYINDIGEFFMIFFF